MYIINYYYRYVTIVLKIIKHYLSPFLFKFEVVFEVTLKLLIIYLRLKLLLLLRIVNNKDDLKYNKNKLYFLVYCVYLVVLV